MKSWLPTTLLLSHDLEYYHCEHFNFYSCGTATFVYFIVTFLSRKNFQISFHSFILLLFCAKCHDICKIYLSTCTSWAASFQMMVMDGRFFEQNIPKTMISNKTIIKQWKLPGFFWLTFCVDCSRIKIESRSLALSWNIGQVIEQYLHFTNDSDASTMWSQILFWNPHLWNHLVLICWFKSKTRSINNFKAFILS